MRKKWKSIFFLSVVLLPSCGFYGRKIDVYGRVFEVPPSLNTSIEVYNVGPDGFTVEFRNREIARRIEGYDFKVGGPVILASVEYVRSDVANKMRQPDYPLYSDARLGKGSYKKRSVFYEPQKNWYIVQHPERNFYATVFLNDPTLNEQTAETVMLSFVAYCGGGERTGVIRDDGWCSRFFWLDENISVDFTIPYENLIYYEEVEGLISDTLMGWLQ